MYKDGLAPVSWVESYLSRKKYADSDRSQFELRCLAKTIEDAMTYDQLNVSSLASFEHLSRRMQQIFGAHALNPQAPNYDDAEHYLGIGRDDDIVMPALRTLVNNRVKETNETVTAMHRARELKTKAPKGDPKGGKGAG